MPTQKALMLKQDLPTSSVINMGSASIAPNASNEATVTLADHGLVNNQRVYIASTPLDVTDMYIPEGSNVVTVYTTSPPLVGENVEISWSALSFANGVHTVSARVAGTSFSYIADAVNVTSQSRVSIINKKISNNIATLTVENTHGFSVGKTVIVSDVDSTFNGTYTITAKTLNSFSYAKTASNVASTPVSGGYARGQLEHIYQVKFINSTSNYISDTTVNYVSLPTGLSVDQEYFVYGSTQNTFRLSAAAGADPITITTSAQANIYRVGYYVRYRITSVDNKRFSAWSPIHFVENPYAEEASYTVLDGGTNR